jgi:uncharacterized membrane protein
MAQSQHSVFESGLLEAIVVHDVNFEEETVVIVVVLCVSGAGIWWLRFDASNISILLIQETNLLS